MNHYIPAPLGQALSEKLWQLTRPAGVQQAGDATTHLFDWVADKTGAIWMIADDQFSIPVHAEAELDGIADILQPFIDAGALPPDTNAVLGAFVESKRGQRLVVYEAFPAFFKAQAKTLEEMIDAGLLAQPLTM
jgi:hypothetical protein